MNQFFSFFTATQLHFIVNFRAAEVKLGERITIPNSKLSIEENLSYSDAQFVVLGIPEDIGVRANGGLGGTQSAWPSFLKSFLNIQSTSVLRGSEVLLLGAFDFAEWIEQSKELDAVSLRPIVHKIDEIVFPLVQQIIASSKIPIVIGGGHNNSYPLIKAASMALAMPINCINLDAHSDFRIEEGRHSGNGFRYAFNQGLLSKYALIGLHENYNSEAILQDLDNLDQIHYRFYEDIFLRQDLDFKQAVLEAINFTDDCATGIELDMDCIKDVLSSASTPSGVSVVDARRYLCWVADKSEVAYLHLAEAATSLADGRKDSSVGKLLTYLVSDFIKAYTG